MQVNSDFGDSGAGGKTRVTLCSCSETYLGWDGFYQTRQRSVVSCLRALAIVNPVFRSDGLRDSPAYTPG